MFAVSGSITSVISVTADGGGIGWPEWSAQYGYRRTAADLGIRYRRVLHALEAVYADSGFMIGGIALLEHLLDAGRITAPFGTAKGAWTRNAYRAEFRGGARRAEVERFREWLLAQADASRQQLLTLAPRP